MDNRQQYIRMQSQYADKIEEFEKCVIKAVRETHILAEKSEKTCKKAHLAIVSQDTEVMRITIQEYICEYGKEWSRLPNVKLVAIDGATYRQLSTDDLTKELHCIITLVYVSNVLKTASWENFKSCVKRIIKEAGIFTKEQLDIIFR